MTASTLSTRVLLLALLLAPALAAQRNGPLPALFPPDNWWNVDITNAPVAPNSAAMINFIGTTRPAKPDFGGDAAVFPEIRGMVYVSVTGTQPRVTVGFEYGPWSDSYAPGHPGRGYPIPPEAKTEPHWIEGGHPGNADSGGGRHMLLVDRDYRILYELNHVHWNATSGIWEAGSGAIFRLDSNERRPETWRSADISGLAILPGLVRYDEAAGTEPIRHALRVTLRGSNGYVYPAGHAADDPTAGALPLGARLRLKAGKDISAHPPEIRRIFQAMKSYGLIVADHGTDLAVQGIYDTRWNDAQLQTAFASLQGADFEVVQLGWRPPVAAQAGPLAFYTVEPCRLLDTRGALSPAGGPALPAMRQRVVVASGRCGIPADAKALSVNLTVAASSDPGYLSLFPGDTEPPATSTLNFRGGRTRANGAIVRLASSGSGAFAIAQGQSVSSVHVIVDVNGYFK